RGPMYGGYHAPFAIDRGMHALDVAFRAARGSTRERIVVAVEIAHRTMREMHDAYEAVRGKRFGLEASRAAADAVRPREWSDYDSYAHFMGSLTACAVGEDAVVIVQIGECHAYA